MFEPPCRVIATVIFCAFVKYQLLEYIHILYLLMEIILFDIDRLIFVTRFSLISFISIHIFNSTNSIPQIQLIKLNIQSVFNIFCVFQNVCKIDFVPSFIRTKNQDHAKQYTLNLDMSYDIEPHVKGTWCTDFATAHICTDICESILQKYHECAINEGVFVCKKKFINH